MYLSSVVHQSELVSREGVVTEELPGGSALKVGVAQATLVQLVQQCFIGGLAWNTRERCHVIIQAAFVYMYTY